MPASKVAPLLYIAIFPRATGLSRFRNGATASFTVAISQDGENIDDNYDYVQCVPPPAAGRRRSVDEVEAVEAIENPCNYKDCFDCAKDDKCQYCYGAGVAPGESACRAAELACPADTKIATEEECSQCFVAVDQVSFECV